jgi:hypothetical protein
MTRLPVTFAEDVQPLRRDWPPGRILLWMMLFGALSLWIGLTLVR